MSIWHPASGISYDQYLQANSFVRDMTGQVKSSSEALEARVTDQTRALVASNDQLAKEFGKGFDSLNSTLDWGFSRLEYVLRDVNASVDALRADFNYSMGLLLEQVQIHNRLLSDLLHSLDAIHKTLQSPTLTQAREFYNIGCERLSKGLLDKALEAFTEAEKKNDTDFFTQFHIGKLHLYGVDHDSNVLDLHKAKRHLLLASRYARAEITVDPAFAKFAAEALLHASIAVYALLGEKGILGDTSKTKQLLNEAKRLVSDAVALHPQFSEALYHSAKFSALLDEPEIAMASLERAVIVDRDYAVKVDIDHAFDAVRPHVLALLSRLRDTKKLECQTMLTQTSRLIEDVSRWHPKESRVLASQFSKYTEDLATAQGYFESQTYFGLLDAILLLDSLMKLLPQLKGNRTDELTDQINEAIRSAQVDLPKAGEYSQSVLNAVRETYTLISQAEFQLTQGTYEAAKAAVSLAESAKVNASSARSQAGQQDRMRARDAGSRGNALEWGLYGAGIGATVLGFSGCWSCVVNAPRLNTLMTPFNLFNGLLYGAIAGLVIGVVSGYLHGQLRD